MYKFTLSNTYIRYRNGIAGRQCRQCRYDFTKTWQINNYDKINKRQRNYWPSWSQKIRKEVLTHYGKNKLECVCCGEKIYAFLTLGHINGNGQEDRKKHNGQLNIMLYLRRKNFPKELENDYQTECWNCNLGKRSNNGICPHKKSI